MREWEVFYHQMHLLCLRLSRRAYVDHDAVSDTLKHRFVIQFGRPLDLAYDETRYRQTREALETCSRHIQRDDRISAEVGESFGHAARAYINTVERCRSRTYSRHFCKLLQTTPNPGRAL